MRVSPHRRIASLAAVIVPTFALLALGAAPALARPHPNYGRLVLGGHGTVSPLGVLIIALSVGLGAGVVLYMTLRSRRQMLDVTLAATLAAVPNDSGTASTERGRKAA